VPDAALIAFDTTSRNSNLALVEFVRDYLDRLGIASELIFDDSGAKANLLATIGPPERAGIVLSGHTDVVPVDGQEWSSDPFTCVERDGHLYGRGTADMKGFVATALALVPEFLAMPLRSPVHLALSFDEEVGCKGVPRLLDHMAARLPVLPWGCVVGEPTGMRIANGHKGKAATCAPSPGAPAIRRSPGVNAIEVAARIIDQPSAQARFCRAARRLFSRPCTVSTGLPSGSAHTCRTPPFGPSSALPSEIGLLSRAGLPH
jgi:acetylornithine deacetylase